MYREKWHCTERTYLELIIVSKQNASKFDGAKLAKELTASIVSEYKSVT